MGVPDFTSLSFCYRFSEFALPGITQGGLEQGSSFCLFFNSFSTVLAGSWKKKVRYFGSYENKVHGILILPQML